LGGKNSWGLSTTAIESSMERDRGWRKRKVRKRGRKRIFGKTGLSYALGDQLTGAKKEGREKSQNSVKTGKDKKKRGRREEKQRFE